MTTVVVTGGCGFIGSHFIRHLLGSDPGAQVVNLDKLTYAGNCENLATVQDDGRYSFVCGDVADRALVRKVVGRGIDAIINFAAESHVDRSISDSSPFVHSNVLGTQVLLEAAREFKVVRYVHVSTDEVYGSLPNDQFAREDCPLKPSSPYAASKAAADLFVLSYSHTYRLPALITRCSNNYGPNQYPEKLIPLVITRLLRNETVPLYGDGLNARDWIHVRDHCRAIDAVWRRGRVGEIYNIGTGHLMTNLELTRTLLNLLGKSESLVEFVPDRPGHDRRYALDCAKIFQELTWRPTIDFADGLSETVQWYQDHRNGAARSGKGERKKSKGARLQEVPA